MRFVSLALFCLCIGISTFAAEFFRKQSGTATIANGSTSVTAAITGVDMSQSFLVFTSTLNSNEPQHFQIGGEITNSTTLTFERSGNSGAVTIKWQVFEFEGGIYVQHGSSTNIARGAPVNVAINCVDVTKTFVLITARKSGSQLGADDGITANITSSTNLQLMISNAGPGGANMEEAYWQIIEYQAATVKKFTTTLNAGSTSTTTTISPAIGNLSKAMVISNHWHDGDVNASDLPRTVLTNTTTVTYTRNTSATNMNFVTYVIEFTDQTTVARGTQNFAAGTTSQGVAITAGASSGVFNSGNFGRQGSTSFSTDDNPGHNWFTYEITSGTNLQIVRAVGTGSTAEAPWQIATFENLDIQQKTFYTRASGAWETNTTWSFTPNGSSGAVPTGVYPRRTNNVVIQNGHTVTVNNVNDNGPCSQSPDGLALGNVGAFTGSGDQMFYQTGDILISSGGTLLSTEELMLAGYTHVESGGTLQVNEDIVNLGYLEISAGATFDNTDDLIISGNSTTIMDNTSTGDDDIYIDHTGATLCGSGVMNLGTGGADPTVQFWNGATSAQVCSSFSITCTTNCGSFSSGPPSGNFFSGNRGPGGVGDQAVNSLWLMADQGVYSNAGTTPAADLATVQQWNDQSGNGRNATEATNKPTYRTSIVNGLPVIRFDNNDRLLSAGVATGNSATVYAVAQYTSLPSSNPGIIQASPSGLGFDGTGNNKCIGMWVSNTGVIWGRMVQSNSTIVNIPQVTTLSVSTYYALSNMMSTTTGQVTQYVNNTLAGSIAYNSTLKSWTDFGIGRQGSETWNGDIAEVIAYNVALNTAQRLIVSNYLSAKYTTALSVGNDVYTMDNSGNGNYDFNVAGIGQASDGTNHRDSRGSGIVRMWNPGGLGNGEFLVWGNDGGALTGTTSGVDGTVIKERFTRIWRVSEAGDVGTVSVSFDFNGIGNPLGSNLRLLIDRDGDGFADNDVTPIVGTVSANVATFSNIDFQTGDRFTLGNTDASIPLPIELVTFRAEVLNDAVLIEWETTSEHNNDFFTVERSHDAEDWESLREVDGAGNSIKPNTYHVTDFTPHPGLSYYRLKQTDFDGHFTYSKIARVSFATGFVSAFPNPSRDTFTLRRHGDFNVTEVTLLNSVGKTVPFQIKESGVDLIIETSGLPSGLYVLRLADGLNVSTIRIVKQ